MAKKGKQQKSKTKKWPLFFGLFLLSGGSWWLWHSSAFSNWRDLAFQYIDNRDISTLEARFLPNQLLEMHRQELLGNDKRTLQNTVLKYYPYLLLDVKYTDNGKTKEGVLLWGMNDGEMVLNTETWQTTHGFSDCLECDASRSDFKLMHALARRNGTATIEELQKDLQIERDVLAGWIQEAKKKHLVMQKGAVLQLHFENPKLLVSPETKVKQYVVTKPLGEGEKVGKTFSRSQIIALTQTAFGNEFKIRSETEIFLPVYSMEILNPDGSVQVSEWNALTGERIQPRYLSKR